MPATMPPLPAAAQRLMAPHRAADANDDFMPHAAVKLVHMAPDDQCLYRSVLAALEDIGHHQSAFTVHRLRQLVQEGCKNNAARKVKIGAWAIPLLEHLAAQNQTLGDLAHRTTLPGKAGWGGIEEVAVLASQLEVVIEIWVASLQRPGYVLWFRAGGASSKATSVARLRYNGTNHYDFLQVRQSS